MRRLFLLSILVVMALSVKAKEANKALKEVKDSYATIVNSFEKSDEQVLSILNYDTISSYISKTDFGMWVEILGKVNQTKYKKNARGASLVVVDDVIVLDSVVTSLSGVEDMPLAKVTVAMSYNENNECAEIKAMITDTEDSTFVIGKMNMEYNEAGYPTRYILQVPISEVDYNTFGTLTVSYDELNQVTGILVRGVVYDESLADIIQLAIKYDGSSRLVHVDMFADENLALAIESGVGMEDIKEEPVIRSASIQIEEEENIVVDVLDVDIAYGEGNQLEAFTIAVNNLYDTAWVGMGMSFTYDGDLVTGGTLMYGFDEDSNWVAESSEELTYNASGKVTSMTYSDYSEDEGGLTASSKDVLVYDEDLLVATYDLSFNETSEVWDSSRKVSYNYNADNLLERKYRLYYDKTNTEWDSNSCYQFAYTDFNKPKSRVYMGYSAGEWYVNNADTLSYDEEQNMVAHKHCYRSSSVWHNSYIDSFYYAGGMFAGHAYYDWEDTIWQSEDKFMLKRDGEDNLSGAEVYYGMDGASDWERMMDVDVEYNTDVVLPQMDLPDYMYDVLYNLMPVVGLNEDLSPINDPDPMFGPGMAGFQSIDDVKSNFKISYAPLDISMLVGPEGQVEGNMHFYYRTIQQSNSIEDEVQLAKQMYVYPNPATDKITVGIGNQAINGTIQVYTLKGEKVLEQNFAGQSQLDISNLETGMYFYAITSGNETVNGKLVVK